MKNNLLLRMAMILVLVPLLGSLSLKAQEWTPVQQEVWNNVNAYWTLMAKGDIDGFLGYFHKDYVGWDTDDPIPGNKESASKWLHFMSQYNKVLIYELKPLTIKVYGDFAFAHYYYYMMNEVDGKRTPEMGRWTDILMKQGDKWLMIGDHGGEEK